MQNFGLEDLSHVQSRRNLLKYLARVQMASDWFTRIYRSILAEQIFLQNRDMACKLGCGLFLSPQKKFLLKIETKTSDRYSRGSREGEISLPIIVPPQPYYKKATQKKTCFSIFRITIKLDKYWANKRPEGLTYTTYVKPRSVPLYPFWGLNKHSPILYKSTSVHSRMLFSLFWNI